MARITYQRFFRRYRRLAGMTGTAREVGHELWAVYRLAVVRVPPNVPRRTRTLPAEVHGTPEEKWRAIAARAAELRARGSAVLVGTRSVAASEALSRLLSGAGVEHEMLNAAQDAREAEIITQAGRSGRITVATNMAGRGVDIPIDAAVRERGGLHVLLSERHDARRIDRQLAGRCGRHGDPGVVETYVSLGDPLLKLAPAPLLRAVDAVPAPWRRHAALALFGRCQRRAERAHSRARRALLRHDQQLSVLLAFSGGLE
jgi:preprotein translocase subunit SecA